MTLASKTRKPLPAETGSDGSPCSDYGAIEAAVMETARGRWFLAEHARRNRHAETARLLAVLDEIKAALSGTKSVTSASRVPAVFVPALSSVAATGYTNTSVRDPQNGATQCTPVQAELTGLVHVAPIGDAHDYFQFQTLDKAG